MGKIWELYETRLKPMVPAERLQLARLILVDFARSGNPIDINDEWGEDDLADLTTHSASHGDGSAGTNGAGNEAH